MALDYTNEPHDPSDPTPFTSLNTKVHGLRQTLSLDATVKIARVVVFDRASLDEPIVGLGGRVSITSQHAADTKWLSVIPTAPVSEHVIDGILAQLCPEFTFTSTFRTGSTDTGAEDRAAMRFVLDDEQAQIARRTDIQIAYLKGPPGSGKTLVLAARARWLAERHPDWRVRLLCFNNALLPHLRSLTAGYPNITSSLITGFAQELGVRIAFNDDRITYDSLAKARRRGLPAIADAILIDEAQDFRPPWLVAAWEGLAHGRGGMLLAGDAGQALYQEGGPPKTLVEKGIEEILLHRPYRSTKSILQAVGNLDDNFSVAAVDDAPDGEPVELIWASSWEGQAKAIAWEINLMLASGDRQPQEIAVLVTTWYGTIKPLTPQLEKLGIPYTVIDKHNQTAFDRSENTVKVMTVHKAKGHEFPVVLLFGLERLPTFDPNDAQARQRARVGFVGFTRAMDQLLITYTRDNDYLKILSSTDNDHVRPWLWPDSYEGAPADG